ncbi:hypothetical protein WG66_005194 [Moniliophthora roreri]|nr:hypothetical protein WG66_005194 [Moniliophthora roreri]
MFETALIRFFSNQRWQSWCQKLGFSSLYSGLVIFDTNTTSLSRLTYVERQGYRLEDELHSSWTRGRTI